MQFSTESTETASTTPFWLTGMPRSHLCWPSFSSGWPVIITGVSAFQFTFTMTQIRLPFKKTKTYWARIIYAEIQWNKSFIYGNETFFFPIYYTSTVPPSGETYYKGSKHVCIHFECIACATGPRITDGAAASRQTVSRPGCAHWTRSQKCCC